MFDFIINLFKKNSMKGIKKIIYLKDGYSAFKVACNFMDMSIFKNQPIPAVVIDVLELPEIESKIYQDVYLQIDLNSASNECYTIARTASPGGPILCKGDLVAWMPLEYNEQLKNNSLGTGCWFGVVIFKLKPILNFETNNWEIEYNWLKSISSNEN